MFKCKLWIRNFPESDRLLKDLRSLGQCRHIDGKICLEKKAGLDCFVLRKHQDHIKNCVLWPTDFFYSGIERRSIYFNNEMIFVDVRIAIDRLFLELNVECADCAGRDGRARHVYACLTYQIQVPYYQFFNSYFFLSSPQPSFPLLSPCSCCYWSSSGCRQMQKLFFLQFI